MFFTRDRNNVTQDLAALRHDLARLTESVSSLAARQAGEARSSVRDAGQSVSATLSELVEQARHAVESLRGTDLGKAGGQLATETGDRLSAVNAKVEARIGRNPLSSLAVAAGVGLLVGVLSRSR